MTAEKAKCQALFDAMYMICCASGLFEEVGVSYEFGCFRIDGIPKLETPNEQPPEPVIL